VGGPAWHAEQSLYQYLWMNQTPHWYPEAEFRGCSAKLQAL